MDKLFSIIEKYLNLFKLFLRSFMKEFDKFLESKKTITQMYSPIILNKSQEVEKLQNELNKLKLQNSNLQKSINTIEKQIYEQNKLIISFQDLILRREE